MRTLENTFKSVLGAPTSYFRRIKTVLVITRFCFSPKMLVGENASILCAEQFSLCVTVVITGFALGHVCLFMLRFFILSLVPELDRCPIVLSHVWPLELCGFRMDSLMLSLCQALP